MSKTIHILLLAAVSLIIGRCIPADHSPQERFSTGSVNLAVDGTALTQADINYIQITITGAGISTPLMQDLFLVNGAWQALVSNIPSGSNRIFLAQAFDTVGDIIFEGQATADIFADQTISVFILLHQNNEADVYSNSAPVIDWVTVSDLYVAPGDSIDITANAHDPDNDPLVYSWSATGGSFNQTDIASPQWTAPASNGSYLLTVSITDSQNMTTTMDFTVEVNSSYAPGNAAINIGLNTWPYITDILASPGQLTATSNTTTLTATANDNDGDNLVYSWTADCAGTFSDATAASTMWTANTGLVTGPCQMTLDISDGNGGTTQGSLVIQYTQNQVENYGPYIVISAQSHTQLAPGGDAIFEVEAADPENAPLSFQWATTYGTLSTPNSTAYESQVVLSAPQCTDAPIIVTVTITDNFTQTKVFDYVPVLFSGPACSASLPSPGNSGGITFSNITTNSATVHWTKATDNQTPQSNLEYQLHAAFSPILSTVSEMEANATANPNLATPWMTDLDSFSLGSLQSSTVHYINIIVRDEDGNKSAYTMASFSTN